MSTEYLRYLCLCPCRQSPRFFLLFIKFLDKAAGVYFSDYALIRALFASPVFPARDYAGLTTNSSMNLSTGVDCSDSRSREISTISWHRPGASRADRKSTRL